MYLAASMTRRIPSLGRPRAATSGPTGRPAPRWAALGVLLGAALGSAACGHRDAATGPSVDRPAFDGAAAKALVDTQVAFGPRIPGRPGHAAQLAWMKATLDSLADEVVVDSFTAVASNGDTLGLANVVAKFRPEATRRIVLLTHWDTRPVSNEAKDPAVRDQPVPGANDGASGTAVLLVLARLFREQAPPMGVDLLFVDGEDYGPGTEDMFYGSKRYAASLPEQGQPGRPVYGVLLDMVGDTDLVLPVEGVSAKYAQPVVNKIWGTARRLGYEKTFPHSGAREVGDDHVPLIEAGLPTADVIDLDYGPGNSWWHTPEDTPDKVSAASLEKVGEVMAELVYTGG